MMDIEKLIERLRNNNIENNCHDCALGYYAFEAATALSTFQAENAQLRESRDHWKRLAHELSEGVNGKDADHERLQAENEKLRNEVERQRRSADDRKHLYENAERAYMKVVAELEQVKRERDAAIADIAAILAEVEEIRRGYGVDNADADNAFADLCRNYCAKNGNACYKEAEDYRCKNFMWRGMRED